MILALRNSSRYELGWAGCEKGWPKVPPKSGTHFLALFGGPADQTGDTECVGIGHEGFGKSLFNHCSNVSFECHKCDTKMTQSEHESGQENGQREYLQIWRGLPP